VATAEYLGIDPAEAESVELAKGDGCDHCFNTGYSGRTGVFEIMGMDAELRDAILRGKTHAEMMELAKSKGMETLEMAAKSKVMSGITSTEEMHRVLTTFV
jgi:type II secretory ATPase GspE/PulE/Tfp pilus assembly ATPase PilB-like protein